MYENGKIYMGLAEGEKVMKKRILLMPLIFSARDSSSSWCSRYISFSPTWSKLYTLLISIGSVSTHLPSWI